MHFNFPHKTTAAAAKEKITSTLRDHRDEIAQHAKITREEWEGDTLNFAVDLQGKTINGTLQITETEYIFEKTASIEWAAVTLVKVKLGISP